MACSITEKCSLCFIFALIFSFFIFQVASCSFFFFFQAEDGIRDHCVTGVQTYALPIYWSRMVSQRTPDIERPYFTTLRSTAKASDRKSTRLNSSHTVISYAVFCLK